MMSRDGCRKIAMHVTLKAGVITVLEFSLNGKVVDVILKHFVKLP